METAFKIIYYIWTLTMVLQAHPCNSKSIHKRANRTSDNYEELFFSETSPKRVPNHGGIFFPDNKPKSVHNSVSKNSLDKGPKTDPILKESLIYSPKCEGSTFCEEVSSYPKKIVEDAFNADDGLKMFLSSDKTDNIRTRMDFDNSDISLCTSKEKLIFPTAAEKIDGSWLYVVNHNNLAQGVRVELCENANQECNMVNEVAEGYRTFCKQSYVYRQLIAVLPNGEIGLETFRLPSNCCCHLSWDYDSASIRMGIPSRNTNSRMGVPSRNLTQSSNT